MDENLVWLFKSTYFKLKGVLHIGAHLGEEADAYAKHGTGQVVWIEGSHDMCCRLKERLVFYPGQKAYCCLASDKDGQSVEFHVTSNDGHSSSVLELNQRVFELDYPDISTVSKVQMKTLRLDNFMRNQGIDLTDCNFLNVDVQGYELPVIKGLGSILHQFEAVICELHYSSLYLNSTVPHELEDYLLEHGFSRAWISVSKNEGSGIWIKSYPRFLKRLFLRCSMRMIEIMVNCNIIEFLKSTILFKFVRKAYYRLNHRAYCP